MVISEYAHEVSHSWTQSSLEEMVGVFKVLWHESRYIIQTHEVRA